MNWAHVAGLAQKMQGGYGRIVPPSAPAPRSGPYPRSTGPLPAGPLASGAVKPISSPAPAITTAAAVGAVGVSSLDSMADFVTPEMEKAQLLQKLEQLQKKSPDAKAKWWNFCTVHGEGNIDPEQHDSAFLLTFFEAFELGEVPMVPGLSWTPAGQAPPEPEPLDQQGEQEQHLDDGDLQTAENAGQQPDKLFVGGLPKTCTEEALWHHFSWYGHVLNVDLKYDNEGGFRGFGFVTFEDKMAVERALTNKEGHSFQGKWIDCKLATGPGTGTGKGCKGVVKGDKGFGKGVKGDMGKAFPDWSGGCCGPWWGAGDWGGSKGSKDGGKSKAAGPGSHDEMKIFVGAMPKTITQDTVWNYFSQFGEVMSVDLKYDENGGFRGFGFVTFTSVEAVGLAVGNSTNNFLDGKWVDVKPAAKGGKGVGGGAGKDAGKGGCPFDKGCGKGDKGCKGCCWKGGMDKGMDKGKCKGFDKGGKAAAMAWGGVPCKGGYGDWGGGMMGGWGMGMGGGPWGWGW